MTTVNYSLYDDRVFLEISGHAGNGDPDEDEKAESEVCAAISMLTMTLCEKVERLDSDGAFSYSSVTVDDGYACFDLAPREEYSENIDTVMDFVMTGMEMLEENYPAFVTVR